MEMEWRWDPGRGQRAGRFAAGSLSLLTKAFSAPVGGHRVSCMSCMSSSCDAVELSWPGLFEFL